MRVYKESDLQSNLLQGHRTAVVGYGNQGHAHAQNLRDSGIDVVVGTRKDGKGWRRAQDDGFETASIGDAVRAADYVAVLLPDEIQGEVFHEEIEPGLKAGASLIFAHGFTIAFGVIAPPPEHDVLLVAPKGQGHYVRKLYMEKKGLPCLFAVEQDSSGQGLERALSYAGALGCLRAGAIETTFREEAITDLFGEQSVLCGGVPGLVKAAFDTLVDRGYSPEIAYLECLHELKIITDLMHTGGIGHMRGRISRTAAWGSVIAEGEIITPELKSKMQSILDAIESGAFAKNWQSEAAGGQRRLTEFADNEAAHPIERAGRPVRELMPYLKERDS